MTTIPDLNGFDTYYGMRVCSVGEDGDLCVLGHHEPLRAIAAMNAYSRLTIGLDGVCDDRSTTVADLLPRLRATWMANCVPLGACMEHVGEPDEDGCSACYEIRSGGWGWWLMEATEQASDAFPVTWWSA